MKRNIALISLLVLMILALSATQALAAGPLVKKTPQPPGQAVDLPEQAAAHQDDKDKKDKKEKKDKHVQDDESETDEDGKPEKDKNPNKPDKGPQKANLRGLIVSFDGETLIVELKNGEQVTIFVGDISIRFPGRAEASLLPGMQVMVRAQPGEEGAPYTALSMNVIPGKPAKLHRVGVVTAYDAEAGTITVEGKHGVTTFTLSEDAQIINGEAGADLVGKTVTIISPRDPAAEPSDEPGNYPIARGVVIHEE